MMINMNKLIVGAVGAVLIFAAQAQAQQVPARPMTGASTVSAATTMPGVSQEIDWRIKAGTALMRVPLNKMVSVRVPADARVIIGNPDIVNIVGPEEAGRTQVYFLGQSVGSTSVFFEDGNGDILFHGDIQVDVDVSGIQAAMAEMLPEEKIGVVSHRNSVFLTGFVRSSVASSAAVNVVRKFVADPTVEVINNMEVLGSQQVIMKVTIAEIKRTAIKQLGLTAAIDATGGFNGLTLATVPSIAPTFASAAITTSLGGLGPLTIKALESEDLAKTLAEPTLTALSGEAASFLVGGSFPMPTAYDAATGTTTYEQTKFGVALNFSPVVLDKGRISMHIQTTVSDRDTSVAVTIGSASVPGLTEKTTETTVELPSGGTLYIGGMLQNDIVSYVEGIPGLKDIPIIGQLFRSEKFQNKETELVISVTAYLAAPTSNSQPLALPSDGFSPSGDLDFYLLGRLNRLYAHKELPPYATPLTGPYGYIME